MDAGIENMKKHYPEYVDEWLKSQYNENGVIDLYNPLTGEKTLLNDYVVKIKDTIQHIVKKEKFKLKVSEEVVK
jgi:hypothetical protein